MFIWCLEERRGRERGITTWEVIEWWCWSFSHYVILLFSLNFDISYHPHSLSIPRKFVLKLYYKISSFSTFTIAWGWWPTDRLTVFTRDEEGEERASLEREKEGEIRLFCIMMPSFFLSSPHHHLCLMNTLFRSATKSPSSLSTCWNGSDHLTHSHRLDDNSFTSYLGLSFS